MTSKEKTLLELREMLDRQRKLLNNKSFIQKLPDKGEKIRTLYKQLEEEVEKKSKIEESCKLFEALSIKTGTAHFLDKKNIENIEWRNKNGHDEDYYEDSDDNVESNNPIAILASHNFQKKKVIHIKNDVPLITKEEIQRLEEDSTQNKDTNSDLELNPHTEYICKKTEKKNLHIKEQFKPYKTLISDVNDPSKEKLFKRSNNWEVTAATPPPSIHGPVKELSIQEALRLQDVQNKHLKEVQIKHAAEKLAAQLGMTSGEIPSAVFNNKNYRNVIESDSDVDESEKETSDQEVYDEEPKDGGVVFTVYD